MTHEEAKRGNTYSNEHKVVNEIVKYSP